MGRKGAVGPERREVRSNERSIEKINFIQLIYLFLLFEQGGYGYARALLTQRTTAEVRA